MECMIEAAGRHPRAPRRRNLPPGHLPGWRALWSRKPLLAPPAIQAGAWRRSAPPHLPGGTTAAALSTFDAAGFAPMVEKAMAAAAHRANTLAEELGSKQRSKEMKHERSALRRRPLSAANHPQSRQLSVPAALPGGAGRLLQPADQGVVRFTDPLLKPLRTLIPYLGGLDIAALGLTLIAEILLCMLTFGLPLGSAILVAAFRLPMRLLELYFWALLIVVILSWVAPMSRHPGAELLEQLTPGSHRFVGCYPRQGASISPFSSCFCS